MELSLFSCIVTLCITLGAICRVKIKEKGKPDRIEKLKELDESKIDSIGKYEKSTNFWKHFHKEK